MPARRDTRTTYSYLAGRDVGLSSGEWQHECEVTYLAAMPLAKRNEFLNGAPGTTDRDGRGIKHHRATSQPRSCLARWNG